MLLVQAGSASLPSPLVIPLGIPLETGPWWPGGSCLNLPTVFHAVLRCTSVIVLEMSFGPRESGGGSTWVRRGAASGLVKVCVMGRGRQVRRSLV